MGAADPAAEAALIVSTPSLRPRFLVFHFRGIFTVLSVFAARRLVELGSTTEIDGFTLGNSLDISRQLKSLEDGSRRATVLNIQK